MELTMKGFGTHRQGRSGGQVGSAGSVEWAGTAAVYDAVYRDLLRVAFAITGSGAVAEDVVQDVFARVGRRMATLEDPVPYLRVAVVNECRSWHRRTSRAAAYAARQSTTPGSSMIDPGLTDLRDALGALPIKQRSAIVLRYLCDLPDEEIASTLGCRRATVRSHVQRGLSQLREVLK